MRSLASPTRAPVPCNARRNTCCDAGSAAALMRAAAEAAVTGGEECIAAGVLARAAHRGPGERRDAVGRELA